MFENLVNYDKSKTVNTQSPYVAEFENLVNYDKSKTLWGMVIIGFMFENLVNYDKSKTDIVDIKGNNCKTPLKERTKTLQVAKTFLKYRQEDLERILSDDGILFRTNRSIQAEGSFGDLKHDMQFRRYLSKGTTNVLAESTLLAMARNINKLHNKIQKGKTGTHLFPLKSA